MSKQRLSALALALAAGLLAIPADAAISDGPDPISGAIADGPTAFGPCGEPFHSGVISDAPDPISGINDNPDPFGSLAIDDGSDPFFGDPCGGLAISIVDVPEPVSRMLVYSGCVGTIITLVGQ